jgi:H+-transporting ATPase
MFKLSYVLSILALGWFAVGLNTDQMRTLTFLTLMMAAQANTYVLRERGHFWHSNPARVMLVASFCALLIVNGLAGFGVLMARLPLPIIGGLFVSTAAFAFTLDAIKVQVFRHLRID